MRIAPPVPSGTSSADVLDLEAQPSAITEPVGEDLSLVRRGEDDAIDPSGARLSQLMGK